METREITEYKVYVLELADMRGGVDKAQPLAVFDSLEGLKSYYESQLAESPYKDKGYNSYAGDDYSYHKVFKKGSPFEWYNPVSTLDVQSRRECAFGGVWDMWTRDFDFTIPFNPNI